MSRTIFKDTKNWQATSFTGEHELAEAARACGPALKDALGRDLFLQEMLRALGEGRVPRFAFSFKLETPIGHGFRFEKPDQTAPLERIDEALAVLEKPSDELTIHTIMPRVHVAVPRIEEFGGDHRLLSFILEGAVFDEKEDTIPDTLAKYDRELLERALSAARIARSAPGFPLLAFVQEHANRHCEGDPSRADEWLRELSVELDRLTTT